MNRNGLIVKWLAERGRPATPEEVRDGLGLSRTSANQRDVSGRLCQLERLGAVKLVKRGGPRTQGLWTVHAER